LENQKNELKLQLSHVEEKAAGAAQNHKDATDSNNFLQKEKESAICQIGQLSTLIDDLRKQLSDSEKAKLEADSQFILTSERLVVSSIQFHS